MGWDPALALELKGSIRIGQKTNISRSSLGPREKEETITYVQPMLLVPQGHPFIVLSPMPWSRDSQAESPGSPGAVPKAPAPLLQLLEFPWP